MTSLKALVVLSGGQDSSTCLFWATKKFGVENVSAVTFDYNQRHSREMDSARMVAHLAGISARYELVKVGRILAGTSPLTDPNQQLEQYDSHDEMEKIIGARVEKTFVPMRNALFLTLAANRAVVGGATHIVTGVCQADNANYPDCRRSFIEQQEKTINEALGNEEHFDTVELERLLDNPAYIRIDTPLMDMSKAQSVLLTASLPGSYSALAYTHTAYDGQFPPTGKDHATVLRAHGFEEAGIPDPLVLRAWKLGEMDLPQTVNYHSGNVAGAMDVMRTELGRTGLLKWWE